MELCMHICVTRKKCIKVREQNHASVLFTVGNSSYQISEKYNLLEIFVHTEKGNGPES